MGNLSDLYADHPELSPELINYHPYRGQSIVFFIIGIILVLITIALFYIAHKKNWDYWWIKAIKIILIIATIILLVFGWVSYNTMII